MDERIAVLRKEITIAVKEVALAGEAGWCWNVFSASQALSPSLIQPTVDNQVSGKQKLSFTIRAAQMNNVWPQVLSPPIVCLLCV